MIQAENSKSKTKETGIKVFPYSSAGARGLHSCVFPCRASLVVETQLVKVGVNGFGRIGCLVTRAAFSSGKVDIITINDPFIDLNYMIYMFQYDPTHGKFNGTIKAENRKLVISGKSITILQE
ncbi:Glyceraldehyde-3-phosphate dehydrogenase [Tupaia chinensis]|uniref:glyceraldehyde-3-phosphate dehydrogenase (phosphorylating) n=1 Tax=Tupaia chinensis TaxID=246437 RepID=L9LGH2_TUPCH|nr:Glyceraldehyde-3-phosphate dehydrogenase [Tupaia chinensis]